MLSRTYQSLSVLEKASPYSSSLQLSKENFDALVSGLKTILNDTQEMENYPAVTNALLDLIRVIDKFLELALETVNKHSLQANQNLPSDAMPGATSQEINLAFEYMQIGLANLAVVLAVNG